jgi:hypothetical protein
MSQDLKQIRKVKATHEAHLLSQPGVTGIDIGYKYVGGRKTDEIVIRVHVREKRAVPPEQQVPTTLDGIKTDVLQEEFKALADDQTYPILQGGICFGLIASMKVGTFGAVVIDNATGTRMLLTNYHVLCHSDGTWKQNELVTQPGDLSVKTIGPLTRAVFDGGTTKENAGVLDAAGAGIEGGSGSLPRRPHKNWIAEIGPVPGGTDSLDGVLRKRGRTTGLTSGTLDGSQGTYQLDYSDEGLGFRWLKDQIKIAPGPGTTTFADKGDSGSVVVNENNEIVGLIVGGAVNKGVATPIASVLTGMDVSIAVAGPRRRGWRIAGLPVGWPRAAVYLTEVDRSIQRCQRVEPATVLFHHSDGGVQQPAAAAGSRRRGWRVAGLPVG